MPSLGIPQGAIDYTTPLQILNSPLYTPALQPLNPDGTAGFAPGEQASVIPALLAWGSGGTQYPLPTVNNPFLTLHLNLQTTVQQTRPFTRCRTIFVNNQNCFGDIQVIFSDTGFPIKVPALTAAYIPVASSSLDVYISFLPPQFGNFEFLPSDATYIEFFNHVVPPVALVSLQSEQSTQQNLALTADLNNSVIAGGASLAFPGVSALITGVSLTVANIVAGAAIGTVNITLNEHTNGAPLFAITVAAPTANQAANASNGLMLDLCPIRVRAGGGLDIKSTHTGTLFASGTVACNVTYKYIV